MTPDVDAPPPPPFCDLAWSPAGPGHFIARPTPLYAAALACARRGMQEAGFILDRPSVELHLSGDVDRVALARQLETWTGVARRELLRTEARDAAMRALPAEAIAAVQAGLSDMVRTDPWALGSRLDLAEGFAGAASLTRKQHDWARDILDGARSAVAAADARLATPAGIEAMERAYDEGVRIALLAACRELSALDGDRCREANDQGWSAVSSAPGHRLASRESLTVLEAAHAWVLVHPHRRQLSPDLRGRLFGAPLALVTF